MEKTASKTVEEAIQLAINQEEESLLLYRYWSENVRNRGVQAFLEGMVLTETDHRRFLEKVRTNRTVDWPLRKEPRPSHLCDCLAEVALEEGSSLQEAAIFVMKREKNSAAFYSGLAEQCSESPPKELFNGMAKIELQQLALLEEGYEEHFLQGM